MQPSARLIIATFSVLKWMRMSHILKRDRAQMLSVSNTLITACASRRAEFGEVGHSYT